MTTTPETMRAMVLTGHGDYDKLEYRTDWPKPTPAAHEVLIKVAACGLNNTDINTRTGWYAKSVTGATAASGQTAGADDDGGWGGALTFPRIQGADVVGTVVQVGTATDPSLLDRRVMVDTWLRDWSDPLNFDRVGYFGSECDGGYAEFATVDARQVHPVDSPLADAELATFATSSITAEHMLERAHVGADDVVLITGASGGVGSALIQLAKRRGARTLAMCQETKADAVRAIGADAVLPRAPANLAQAISAAMGEARVTVVADVVGGPGWPQLIEVLAHGGRYTCSGAIAGPIVELDLRTLYLHDLTFTGATVIPPGLFAQLVGYIERGEIKPLLAATYPLEQLADAQRAFVAKEHVGNIVAIP